MDHICYAGKTVIFAEHEIIPVNQSIVNIDKYIAVIIFRHPKKGDCEKIPSWCDHYGSFEILNVSE